MKTGVDAGSPERLPIVARRLAPCLYLLAIILIVVPLVDAATTAMPSHAGNVQWRFGAIGLLSNTLLTPGLGFLLAVVTAVTFQHLRTQRALAILSWLAIVALVGLLVMFTLDALQTRPLVRPEHRIAYYVACVTAACKMVLWMVAFFLFGRACRVPRAFRRIETPAPGMLIRDAQPSSSAVRS
jgi:hypothetical protein